MAEKTQLRERQSTKDVDVVEHELPQIHIPQGMSLQKASEWLLIKAEQAEAKVAVNEPINGFPMDCAYALSMAVNEMFGMTAKVPTPTWFGPQPPKFISVTINAEGDTVDVYMGRFTVPTVDGGYLETSPTADGIFMGGVVKQKDMPRIKKLAALARQKLKSGSLLKKKSFIIGFKPEEKNAFFALPTFIKPNPDAVICLNDDILAEVDASLWTVIRNTQKCRELGIPIKRGLLFAGPFGTGKTLAMSITAYIANQNGWTYIYLKDVNDLAKGLELAKHLAPAVIAAEDLDLVGNSEEVRNVMDAVHTKSMEVIVILTTNHVEKLDMALRRPGRLDSVIPFCAPNAKTAANIVKLYAGSELDERADMEIIGVAVEGQIPAVISEVVKRAKLHSLRLGHGGMISTDAVVNAAQGMKYHLELLMQKPKVETPAERLSNAFREHISSASRQGVVKALVEGGVGEALVDTMAQGETGETFRRLSGERGLIKNHSN